MIVSERVTRVDAPEIPLWLEFHEDFGHPACAPHPSAESNRIMAEWLAESLAAQLGFSGTAGSAPEGDRKADAWRAPERSEEEIRAQAEACRALARQRLKSRIDAEGGTGVWQVYGGLNPDGTLGPRLCAIMKAAGFFEWEALHGAIEEQFGKKYASLMKGNLDALKRGYDEVKFQEFPVDGKYPPTPFRREEPKLGYETAPIGGTIYSVGNMRFKDLSTSRTGMIPLFLVDKCTRCGECDITCPDYCFVWEKGKDPKTGKDGMILRGIDYQFCKGCLRCTYICKFGALVPAKEAEQDMEKITVKHKFLE